MVVFSTMCTHVFTFKKKENHNFEKLVFDEESEDGLEFKETENR